jgi:formyltetrahydrofolate-dependent phosphoribosylglycinamide formyltransferase
MLGKLKEKWKVGNRQLLLILIVFAFTGSTTAWMTKYIAGWLGWEAGSIEGRISKIFFLIIGYQVLLLSYGFLFGQFAFFWRFEKKLLQRLRILPRSEPEINIAVFASGKGSNFENLLNHFKKHPTIRVNLLICNKIGAGAMEIADKQQVRSVLINFSETEGIKRLASELQKSQVGFLVLAGFLKKLPPEIISLYRGRILNIHPALLPAYGGRGMYGRNVHEAVLKAGEKESGISIHEVDEHYDNGKIIFQANCSIDPEETAESLAAKIHALEQKHFPEQVELFINNQTFR